jgi:hypothetical protein
MGQPKKEKAKRTRAHKAQRRGPPELNLPSRSQEAGSGVGTEN